MLEDQLSSKRDRVANVFVFGDPSSGKKRMLDGLKKYTSLDSQEARRPTEDSPIKDLEKVYIMDFKFIHLRQIVEDEVQEIGKINFFIYNRKYSFIGELLTHEMMQNMLLVFVLDLESPETIEESLNSWFEYVLLNIAPFLRTFDPDTLKELSQSYANTIKKFHEFGRINPEAAKKTVPVDVIVEEKEEDEKDKDAKPEDGEAEGADKSPEKAAPPAEDQIRIPIIIVGAKADKLEELSNNALKDFVEFTLQRLAKKLGAVLFTISAFKDWNMDLVSQFVLYTMFGRVPDNFSSIMESEDIKRMFMRADDIDLEDVKNKYPGAKTFVFPKKKEVDPSLADLGGSDIKTVNEFLQDVKEGKFKYSEETESSVFVSNSNPAGFYSSGTTGAPPAPDRSGLFAIQTDRIRNLLKQNG